MRLIYGENFFSAESQNDRITGYLVYKYGDMGVFCAGYKFAFTVAQSASVIDVPGAFVDRRYVNYADRIFFTFKSMASAMTEAERSAKMLYIQVMQRFTAKKIKRFINFFWGYSQCFLAWLRSP